MNLKITLDIKKDKFSTFIAFIKTLGYVTIPNGYEVPQWQQTEVDRRLKELKEYPNKVIDFDVMLNELEAKYGL